jgi:hypothetical protein
LSQPSQHAVQDPHCRSGAPGSARPVREAASGINFL